MYTYHTSCRACGYGKDLNAPGTKTQPTTGKLIPVFDLGLQPLANDFRKQDEERAGFAPLEVLFCPRCSLAQLSVVVDPAILYRNYCYVTSPSATMQDHFTSIIGDIQQEASIASVVEIGSNDGLLLQRFHEAGAKYVLGVDPAENLAKIAEANNVPTICQRFTSAVAEEVKQKCIDPDVIIARHVFCHADNWKDFVAGLELLSHGKTLVCIEAPYAANTISRCEFDQVYHEHLSYLSLKAVDALLDGTGLYLEKIKHYGIHGGSVMLFIRRRDFKTPGCSLGDSESITLEKWLQLGVTAHNQINRLQSTVMSLKASGKRIAGLGASAKSTVWVNACGFSQSQIDFIADNTPQKQLTFSPGTNIPIVDEGAIYRELPDYVILFAWNYRDEILKKFAAVREKGVKFIVPVPTITVV